MAVPERPTAAPHQKRVPVSGTADATRAPPHPRTIGAPLDPQKGWSTSMPNDRDLFEEEKSMVTMSFGEHIEELRTRLILAMYGLVIGVVLTLIPGLSLGKRIMTKM